MSRFAASSPLYASLLVALFAACSDPTSAPPAEDAATDLGAPPDDNVVEDAADDSATDAASADVPVVIDDTPAPIDRVEAVDVPADRAVVDVPPARDVVDVPAVPDVPAPIDRPAAVDVPVVMDHPVVMDVAPAVDRPDVLDAPVVTDRPDVVTVADAGCVSPSRVCGALMRCVDVQSDAENCGRCDNRCAAGNACSRGACVAVTQLAAGEVSTCARLADGAVQCWGHNEFGQLGDGTFARLTFHARPWPVQGITDAVEVAVGRAHACARLASGAVRCWGANSSGQTGAGTFTTAEPTPVTVTGITSATALAAGWGHTCAVLADRTVRCWGSGSLGQLGDGTMTGRATPVAVAGLTTAQGISAGHFFTCARLADGTAQCWGSNSQGQLGTGVMGNSPRPVAVSGLAGVASVTAGAFSVCALLTNGTARCWGDNSAGQLGDGTTTQRTTPVAVAIATGLRSLALGTTFTCARTVDDSVWCWGTNRAGQTGDGFHNIARFAPAPVAGLGAAVEVVAGDVHACARTRAGAVTCWGGGSYGQLGNDAVGGFRDPQVVTGLSGVAQVAARDHHTCARLTDGTARCWGQGNSGELGDNMLGRGRFTPGVVTGLTSVAEIALGSFHNCARLSDRTVRCWGYNDRGQCGDGTVVQNRATPVMVTGLTNATQLALGQTSTCALTADRTVRCWGANNNGRLGQGYEDMFGHELPSGPVRNLTDAASVGMGLFHVCAVRGDGALWCWGANDRGQLGDGTLTSRFVATAIPLATDVTQMTGGYQHTCALRRDGTVACWGLNASGQCGNGSVGGMLTTPTVVAGLTGVTELAAGEHFTCALRRDGTVACWGNNDYAQLGDAALFVSRATPATVPGLAGVASLTAGASHACARLNDGTVRCWGAYGLGQLGGGHLFNVRF